MKMMLTLVAAAVFAIGAVGCASTSDCCGTGGECCKPVESSACCGTEEGKCCKSADASGHTHDHGVPHTH